MKNRFYPRLLTFVAIVFAFSYLFQFCDNQKPESYLFSVGQSTVYKSEFESRFKFNPYLRYWNRDQAKLITLSSLIAEKLLYNEALHQINLSDTKVKQLIDQYEKEAVIEQLKRDSIDAIINVTKSELWDEYEKSIKKVEIAYIAFETLDEAEYYKSQIQHPKDFYPVLNSYMNKKSWDEETPKRTVEWNDETIELESLIYSMNIDHVSDPIKAYGAYYLIKVLNIHQIREPSLADFKNRHAAIEDKVRRIKIKKLYQEFYERNIAHSLPSIDWKKLHRVADLLVESFDFPELNTQSSSKQLGNLPEFRNPELYLNEYNFVNQKVMEFSNKSLTIKEVLLQLNIGPYNFDYSNPVKFKRSFAKNVSLMAEHETIYNFGVNAGYKDHREVKKQSEMWKSFLLSNELRYKKLATLTKDNGISRQEKEYSTEEMLKKKRLIAMDNYLSKLLAKYEVKINPQVYHEIQADKSDMVVKKTHFANRLIAPPLEPFVGLPKWNDAVNLLFKEKSLQ